MWNLLIGGVFVIYGIIVIIRREVKVGLFGGRSGGASPLVTVSAYGRGAIIVGITTILGATLFGLSSVWHSLAESLSADFISNLPGAGVLVMIGGMFLGPIWSDPPAESDNSFRREDEKPEKGSTSTDGFEIFYDEK